MYNLNPLWTRAVALVCLASPVAAKAGTRVRIEPGTQLPVRLDRSVSTKDIDRWHSFDNVRKVPGTLVEDVVGADGRVALRAGTRVSVAVLESKRAGHVMGRSSLRLGLYSVVTPEGEVVPLDGYPTNLSRHKTDAEGTAHGIAGAFAIEQLVQ